VRRAISLLRNELNSPEGLEVLVNHPLAPLFDQFLTERRYLKNVTDATLTWYRVAFSNYASLVAIDPAAPLPSKASLLAFVVALRERGIRPVTCNTYVGAMNAFCAWLQQEGHCAQRVKVSKLRVERRLLTLLDEAQMRALIGYRPKTFRQARVQLAVLLILDTGLRISETLHLRDADIDFDNLVLKVFGKGQKERFVPFSPELRRRVYRYQQWKQRKSIVGEWLFTGLEGSRWEKRNSTTSLYLLQDRIGLPRFGWHRLRHTFATNYLRQGGDIVRLSIVLGHTQITTTQRYLHLVTADLQSPHQRLSLLNRLR
jgi:site-specific recombinase XerD